MELAEGFDILIFLLLHSEVSDRNQALLTSGNLAQGLTQTQLEERLTDHCALYWWTVNRHLLARNRKR
eukprot:1719701-Rhodomonas_salina.1